ncbi:hypothetical protein AYP77_00575 [Lactobacillus crispatus]|uniref:hypothetical protein n=1 Tax=Lactobacillus crispatus TaxID=47770 RepID=UPI000B5DA0E2|nr:hypothetical protein [Lactobacillus crispatus]OXC13587.1 hypothetical protein AYP77_00575 [Lactobacillus crispatus]
MAVVNEVMTIINVIMSFALMVLIIISTHQDIKTWRLINKNLSALLQNQRIMWDELDLLQEDLIQVQKGEVANAKSINAIARKMTELHDLVIEDQTRQDQDIKALATLMSGLKTSSYRSRNDEHFNDALKRIAKLVKE